MTARGRKIKFYTNTLASMSFETTDGDFRLTHGRMTNELHMYKLSNQLLYDGFVLMLRKQVVFNEPAVRRKTRSLIREYYDRVAPGLHQLEVVSIVFYTKKIEKVPEMVVVMEDGSELNLRQGEAAALVRLGVMSKEQLRVAIDLGYTYLHPKSEKVRDSYNYDRTHDRALAVFADFHMTAEEYIGQ